MSSKLNNDASFFNIEKIKTENIKNLIGKNIKNDSNIGSEVPTLMPDRSIINGEYSQRKIPIKKMIIKRKQQNNQWNTQPIRLNSSTINDNESILSEIDSVVQENVFETDQEKNYYNDIIFPTKETKIKYEYINMLTAFKNKGYNVPKVSEKDNIKKIMSIYEATLIEIKNKEKYELYNGCIYTIAWALEWIMKYLHNGSEYEGWADHVWNHISEFKHHFDRMIVPTYEKNQTTGEIIRKENSSLINKYNPDPIFSVFLTLFRMFIVYTGLRKIANLTDYVPERKSTELNNMSDEELSKVHID